MSTLDESTSVVVRQAIVVFLASVVIGCCIPHRDHEVPTKETRSKEVSGRKEIGHILLIHGSSPFNRDGQLPIKGKGIYSKIAFFKKIADELEKIGWSEGTLHATLLDKSQMDAIIQLGGISTNIKDIIREQLGREGKKLETITAALESMQREEMLGIDRPVERLLDELALQDNWRNLKGYETMSLLILHGERDKEAPVSQAHVWKNGGGNREMFRGCRTF